MSSKATITPFLDTNATQVELGEGANKKTYWRKQILPTGTRQYKGTTLDFSKINPSCVDAFDKMKDVQPVYYVFANPDNSHPKPGEETERMEGTLHKVELASDGLYGYFDFSGSKKAVEVIEKSNGRFGVSAKIAVGYERGDTGEKFDYALTHVCGTPHPHIKGMGGWQAVELSDVPNDEITVDLSTEVIEDKDADMPATKAELLKLLGLGEDDLSVLAEFKTAQAEIEKMKKETPAGGSETVTAALSEAHQRQIELAEENSRNAIALAEAMQKDAAKSGWETKKILLARDGVPPAILDKAALVLSSHKPMEIVLSDTEKVDGRQIISDILDLCKGYVPLTAEEGSQLSGGATPQDAEDFKSVVKDWDLSDLFPGQDFSK